MPGNNLFQDAVDVRERRLCPIGSGAAQDPARRALPRHGAQDVPRQHRGHAERPQGPSRQLQFRTPAPRPRHEGQDAGRRLRPLPLEPGSASHQISRSMARSSELSHCPSPAEHLPPFCGLEATVLETALGRATEPIGAPPAPRHRSRYGAPISGRSVFSTCSENRAYATAASQ